MANIGIVWQNRVVIQQTAADRFVVVVEDPDGGKAQVAPEGAYEAALAISERICTGLAGAVTGHHTIRTERRIDACPSLFKLRDDLPETEVEKDLGPA